MLTLEVIKDIDDTKRDNFLKIAPRTLAFLIFEGFNYLSVVFVIASLVYKALKIKNTPFAILM